MRRPLIAILLILGLVPPARADHCSDGGALLFGSMAFDILTAPLAAKAYNRKHFSVVPTVDPVQRRTGFAVKWTPGSRDPVAAGARERRPHTAQDARLRTRKSPVAAFAFSALGTAVPLAIGLGINDGLFALGGVVLGPGLGQAYAGQPLWFLGGAVLRFAGIFTAFCGYT